MKCSVEDCNERSHCKGWCGVHYGRWYRNGDPLVSVRQKNKGKTCSVDDCDEPAFVRLLCRMHDQRMRKHGDPLVEKRSGPNNSRWNGGRHVNNYGYIEVWIDKNDPFYCMSKKGKNLVLEHRLVMAKNLGRPLTEKETVHHINGDRSDNRLENLQLRSGSHGQGVVLECSSCGSHDIKSVRL